MMYIVTVRPTTGLTHDGLVLKELWYDVRNSLISECKPVPRLSCADHHSTEIVIAIVEVFESQ
jgi:hypothetical protein